LCRTETEHEPRITNSHCARRKKAFSRRPGEADWPAALLYFARGEWAYRAVHRNAGENRRRLGNEALPIALRRRRTAQGARAKKRSLGKLRERSAISRKVSTNIAEHYREQSEVTALRGIAARNCKKIAFLGFLSRKIDLIFIRRGRPATALSLRCRFCPDCRCLTVRHNLGDASSKTKCDCGVCGGVAAVCRASGIVGAIHNHARSETGKQNIEGHHPPNEMAGKAGMFLLLSWRERLRRFRAERWQPAIEISEFPTSEICHELATVASERFYQRSRRSKQFSGKRRRWRTEHERHNHVGLDGIALVCCRTEIPILQNAGCRRRQRLNVTQSRDIGDVAIRV
jgi:hypothetical protein